MSRPLVGAFPSLRFDLRSFTPEPVQIRENANVPAPTRRLGGEKDLSTVGLRGVARAARAECAVR